MYPYVNIDAVPDSDSGNCLSCTFLAPIFLPMFLVHFLNFLSPRCVFKCIFWAFPKGSPSLKMPFVFFTRSVTNRRRGSKAHALSPSLPSAEAVVVES